MKYCGSNLQVNYNQNTKIFIQGNVFENVVYKMVTILSENQCAKKKWQQLAFMQFAILLSDWY